MTDVEMMRRPICVMGFHRDPRDCRGLDCPLDICSECVRRLNVYAEEVFGDG